MENKEHTPRELERLSTMVVYIPKKYQVRELLDITRKQFLRNRGQLEREGMRCVGMFDEGDYQRHIYHIKDTTVVLTDKDNERPVSIYGTNRTKCKVAHSFLRKMIESKK